MSGRKLNPLEQKLHQAALADSKKTLTQKECEVLIPDAGARTGALNFLLGTGLLKALKDAKGAVSFRAVMKKELDVKKDMSGEESMILSYIQAAATEGIWTKHLKAKTELHQTVIDRCLKSLTQKALIKAVKSVKFPTRKIYMLAHLEPSVEMTGGPWYTDNELDTEFIKLLCSACLRFIRDKSAPKQKGGDSETSNPLYPISASPSYPTAQQLLAFLSKSRITETQLSVEHVEMLLNVLVLDGDVERVPAFGAAMWDTSEDRAGDASDDDRERSRRRKRKSRDEDDSPKRRRKRSKRSRSSSGSDSDSESDSEDEREKRKRRKKRKSRDSSASESEDEKERRKRKKKRSRETSANDGEDVQMSDEEGKRRSKSSSKSKKRRKHDSDSSDSESDSGSDSRSRSSKSKSSRSKAKSKSKRERSSSPAPGLSQEFGGDEFGGGGAYVYRAVRQERIAGGLSQTPCVRCPAADFCKPGGPVNPQECTYYDTWLIAADVAKG